MLKALVTAVRTLTIIPVPGREATRPASALPWFPIVGAALGGMVWAATAPFAGAPADRWAEGAAALAVVLGVLLTRALHVDGLADWADACGCLGDRQTRLAVMKDPRVGAFGVAAVASSLGLKWIAIARLVRYDAALWIVASYLTSRAMQVELAGALPYARAEGGTASAFVAEAGWPHRLVAAALALGVLGVVFGPAGLLGFLGALVIARCFGAWCQFRAGGLTGDLLGAASEIVETAHLFTAAALVRHLEAAADWHALWRAL